MPLSLARRVEGAVRLQLNRVVVGQGNKEVLRVFGLAGRGREGLSPAFQGTSWRNYR